MTVLEINFKELSHTLELAIIDYCLQSLAMPTTQWLPRSK